MAVTPTAAPSASAPAPLPWPNNLRAEAAAKKEAAAATTKATSAPAAAKAPATPAKKPAAKPATPAKAAKDPAKKAAKAPAKAAKAPAKAAKKPKTEGGTRGRAPNFDEASTITIKSKENPKRGTAAERFDLYKDGMTIAKYIAAGGKRADVNWDSKQGFIKVTPPAKK